MEYDANGALTKSDDSTTVNVYTYDYDGYLAAFDTAGTENDATYTYDADKRRIAKTVDSTTTKYFLDGSNVIADFDGDDVLLATYVTPGLDANLSQTRGGSTYYYMADGLGSIRNLVDSSETTQNTYDYYAFGKELGQWTQNVTNRYTYTAREYDAESSQYYYRARYYSGSGRFNRRDPVRDAVNLYVYVSARPVILVDPAGKASDDSDYPAIYPVSIQALDRPAFDSVKDVVCPPKTWIYQWVDHLQSLTLFSGEFHAKIGSIFEVFLGNTARDRNAWQIDEAVFPRWRVMKADAHLKFELCCVCPSSARLKTLGPPHKKVLTVDNLLMFRWNSKRWGHFQDLKKDCITPIKKHSFDYEWSTFQHTNEMYYESYVEGVPYHGSDFTTGILFVDPSVSPE